MRDDAALARAQEALLDALEAGAPPDVVRARVAAVDPEMASWAASWEDRPLEVARDLVKRWTRR